MPTDLPPPPPEKKPDHFDLFKAEIEGTRVARRLWQALVTLKKHPLETAGAVIGTSALLAFNALSGASPAPLLDALKVGCTALGGAAFGGVGGTGFGAVITMLFYTAAKLSRARTTDMREPAQTPLAREIIWCPIPLISLAFAAVAGHAMHNYTLATTLKANSPAAHTSPRAP